MDVAIAAAAHDALVAAIDVGALPFPQFGTPALQASAVAQVDAERKPRSCCYSQRSCEEQPAS